MPRALRCSVDCFYTTDDGVVLHDKDTCIGCGYCFIACPFGAPQLPEYGAFASRGKMDKCTFCAGGPEENGSAAEYRKYGANRLGDGKLPLCAEMCSTKALLAGDANVIAGIYRKRVVERSASVLNRGVGSISAPLCVSLRVRRVRPRVASEDKGLGYAQSTAGGPVPREG